MIAYFTDPMEDEFKKALERAIKSAARSGKEATAAAEDPDAVKRAKWGVQQEKSKTRKSKQKFSKQDKKKLR